MRKKIKSIVTLLLLLSFMPFTGLSAQRKDQIFIQSTFSKLDYLKSLYGVGSSYYLRPLVDATLEFNDSIYADLFPEFADRLNTSFSSALQLYGADSEEFRLYCVATNGTLLGKYFGKSNYVSYHETTVGNLLSLEKLFRKVSHNREEFATILSGLYQFYMTSPDYKKALQYGKIKFNEAMKKHGPGSQEAAYACSNLCSIYGALNDVKGFNEMFDTILACKDVDQKQHLELLCANLPDNLPDTFTESLMYKLKDAGVEYQTIATHLTTKLAKRTLLNGLQVFERLSLADETLENKYAFYRLASQYLPSLENKIDYLEKALDLADSTGRQDLTFWSINDTNYCDWQTLSCYFDEAGNLRSAIMAQQRAVEAFESKYGEKSIEVLDALQYLSLLCSACGDYANEIDCLNKMIAICTSLYGYDNEKTTGYNINVAGAYKAWAKYAECADKCLEILKTDDLDTTQLATVYNLLGQSYNALSIFDLAETCYKKAIEITPDKNYVRNLSMLYADLGEIEKSQRVVEEMYSDFIIKDVVPEEAFDYYMDLASVYPDRALEYYRKAEPYIPVSTPRRCIEYYHNRAKSQPDSYSAIQDIESAIKAVNGVNYADSIMLGVLKRDLGDYYCETKNYRKGMVCYNEALSMLHSLDTADPQLTSLLNNTAICFGLMSQYDRAIRINRLLCEIRKSTLGEKHPDYQTSLSNLFTDYINAGLIEQADSIRKEIIATDAIAPGRQAIYTAMIDYERGHFDKALSGFIKSAKAFPASKQKCEEYIRKIYRRTDLGEYVAMALSSLKDTRKDIIGDFVLLSDAQRRAQSFYVNNILNETMSDVGISPKLTQAACDFNIFRKGLLFHTEKEIRNLLAGYPAAHERLMTLRSLKADLNKYIARGDSAMVANLRNLIEKTDRDLSAGFVSYGQLKKRIDLTTNDVLSNLPKKALALDFVRYTSNDIIWYGVFIISERLKMPEFLPLFTEDDLKSNALSDTGVKSKFYRDKSNKGYGYRFIWSKLEPYMVDCTSIYFCGDGLLNQVAIEFLPDENDVPVSDKYSLHRVFHLATISKDIPIGDGFVAVGVSDYSDGNLPSDSDNLNPSELRSADRGSWASLPNVESEINNIVDIIEHSPVTTKIVFLDNDARENNIKALSQQNFSIFHFATHGFYKDELTLTRAFENPENPDHNIAVRTLTSGETSMSGLVLRTGNLSWNSPAVDNDNDDILTNTEIENLSFPALRLTVLSACESGLGDIDTEGVWGLQRAFRIAGTQKIICSLRTVDDRCTSEFMQDLYANLSKGENISTAFKLARANIYINYKKKPEYWAAFILIE